MAAPRCGRCSTNFPTSWAKSKPPTIRLRHHGNKTARGARLARRASRWLLERVGSAPNDALAGATPYLRLFGATLGGCMLAGEALAARAPGEASGDAARYVTLARFFAENVSVQAPSLERTVTDSAEAVNARMRCCWGNQAARPHPASEAG